jgi:hypothetical protein
MKSINPLLLLLTVFAMVPTTAAQRHFDFDGLYPPRLVTIPTAVLRVLHEELQRYTHLPNVCRVDKSTDISSWFRASRIDLTRRHRAYLLTSTKGCLTGADNTGFWVILKTDRGYRLVRTSGTLSVRVLSTRTHGLRDIKTGGANAATNYIHFFKFDGRVYKRVRCLQASPPEAKPKPVPCGGY